MNLPRIGMRNIKTTLSVFLCLLLFDIISRENSIYACVAAVICMQNTIVDSLEKGVSRVLGTIVGGLVGIFVLFVVSEIFIVNEDMMIFIIPLGIILLIEICVMIDQKQAVVISCVVYLSILISKNRDGGYVLYTVNRVLDTSIGIVIALLVNKYVVMPERLRTFLNSSKYNNEENICLDLDVSDKKEDDDVNEKSDDNQEDKN
ncbi:MAG: fusaric acid resistance family protein [Sedimentibacter sp.]|nr:fusaric acid resistance family protein [Sedimentibacter sp.]